MSDHTMRCEELTERVCDRLTGELDRAAARELDAHLEACSACAAEAAALAALWDELGAAEPASTSRRLRARFDAMLARESALAERANDPIRSAAPGVGGARMAPRGRRWSLSLGAAAALAATLVAALGAGVYLGSSAASRRDAQDLAVLRDEIRSLRTTVALALLAEPSASERLSGVAYGRDLQARDDRVAEALYAAFLGDPNVNVRLAALDALSVRAARPEIRARLLDAIPAQDSPLVQLSAIDVLLESGAGEARDEMARLAERTGLDSVVRGYLLDRLERNP